ncbi:beta/gamma crystallin-related protein [Massilia horti]|uniref:Beta/gamma crystallin 'Greek key' domain-containing protein n=1 Tax=Massilia horti TaxID=2562153 RepID=A0A4Y9T6Z6_9BURK|nr:beta/gamma crystallin-related protein [Massilia horti]TFW33061.1 hypothetical protein E4O92_07870 [Massilia horti]
MKRLLAAAAVLASLTQAAVAGELTLFEHSDFRGRPLILRGDAPNLVDYGFNDRTSSVVVRSGTWLLCEHRDFGGYCAEFGPGEYRELGNLGDRISSAREIVRRNDWRDGDGYRRGERDWRGEREGGRESYRDEREGYRGEREWRSREAVQMFSAPRFAGGTVNVSENLRTLRDVGFNDRAASIIVHEGRWEFCEHADFHGQCVVFGPGRYEFLGAMNNRISSMRRVR